MRYEVLGSRTIWVVTLIFPPLLVPKPPPRYSSVKNGFDSAILTETPRMKKEERAGSATDD